MKNKTHKTRVSFFYIYIVIKFDSGIDPAKKPSLGLHGLIWIKPGQPDST
jgi:hypothetical protein